MNQYISLTWRDRKEELTMFEEFRRRRQEKTFDMKSDVKLENQIDCNCGIG